MAGALVPERQPVPAERQRALAIPAALTRASQRTREERTRRAPRARRSANLPIDYVTIATLDGHLTLVVAVTVGRTRLTSRTCRSINQTRRAGAVDRGHIGATPGRAMPDLPPIEAGKLAISALGEMKRARQPITPSPRTSLPSGRLADGAGIEVVLVGDSAAMTVFGYDSTLPITMDEMVTLTRAVVRSVRRAIVVADMPFGSFQVSDETDVAIAIRLARTAAPTP